MKTRTVATGLLVSVLALLCAGCTTVRDPRQAALAKAQRFYDAGRYSKALQATELAEASANLDPKHAAQALVLRGRCLEALGQREPAEAHYRYVVDQYPTSELVAQARAAVQRLDVDAAANAPQAGGEDLAEWGFLEEVVLEYPDIRYPDLALGLGVGGTVVVAFQVNEDGQATQIRVLSAPHPLLGGAAIDAISQARIDPTMLGLTDRSALPALRQTKINFELE
jgi:TonB family protein